MASPVRRYAVWTVRPASKEGQKPFWTRIGTGFLHKNNGGINVVLDALPIDGKLVILPAKKKDDAQPSDAPPAEGEGGHEG